MSDTLISVCYTFVMDTKRRHKVRRVFSRGTPSYQLGRYEMVGKPGARRSVFKVGVHLGEHATPEEALAAWPEEIARARAAGRENKAVKLEGKLGKLRSIVEGEENDG